MTAAQKEQTITDIVNTIASNFDPDKIILFGSHAWGEPSNDSDIDLLVVKETNNTQSLRQEIDRALFPRSFPLDILVCRPHQIEADYRDGDFFMRAVIDQGKVIYERGQ